MTNDEKAKAYDEALERAKEQIKECGDNEGRKKMIRSIFPELRESESEDERIRKWLVDYFSSIKKTVWIHRDITCEQILEWLEKQKEPTTEELYAEAGTTEKEYIANTMKMVRAMREKKQEQKPISSCDIVPYIDEKIAALQDMWREEKVSFDWDDMKDMIEDVARHFYHKEQKPSTGIYWHAIKRGDKIPCRAYLYKVAYETENNFGGRATIDGLLVPNIENVTCGCDTWYLPADDVKNLPREGLDELQKENPKSADSIPADCVSNAKCPYKIHGDEDFIGDIKDTPAYHFGFDEGVRSEREKQKEQKPDWSEEDADMLNCCISSIEEAKENRYAYNETDGDTSYDREIDWLKSLRPSWKPSDQDELMKLKYAGTSTKLD